MKKLLLLPLLMTGSSVWANSKYESNSFGIMPHKDIMRLNVDSCNTEANAVGNPSIAKLCIGYQEIAFEKLLEIYNDKSITAPSWSLCVGESKTGHSYNYVTMYACMKVVKDICPENADGSWKNYNLCVSSIQSGAWINNPKVYQPYKSSRTTKTTSIVPSSQPSSSHDLEPEDLAP